MENFSFIVCDLVQISNAIHITSHKKQLMDIRMNGN